MAQEFKDLNDAYVNGKEAHNFIQAHIKEIFAIRQKLLVYSRTLSSLQLQKSQAQDEMQIFQGFSFEGVFDDIDSQIQDIKDKIEALKKDKLYMSEQQIQDVSKDLDAYLDLANTNPDFQLAIRNEIISQSNDEIKGINSQIGSHKASIALVELINQQAGEDPSFKDILSSIDSTKASLIDSSSLNDILKDYKDKHNDPRSKAKAEALISDNENDIVASTKTLETKAKELKKYIAEHREKFGLPVSSDELDFDNENSPLYVVSMYTDAKSNLSLDDIAQNHFRQMQELNDRISELQNFISYANQDIQNISQPQVSPDPQTVQNSQTTPDPQTAPVKTERDFQALYVSLKDKVKNLFKTLTKGVKNWLQDKPFFDKGTAQPVSQGQAPTGTQAQVTQSQVPPTSQTSQPQVQSVVQPQQPQAQSQPTPEVVDTVNNFKDAYKTEIGQEEYKRVIEDYQKRISQQTQQQKQTTDEPDR